MPTFRSYAKVLDFLFSQLPMYQRIGNVAYKKNLDNTLALCEALGNPQNHFPCIHIAGTNGKGSTTHLMGALYQEKGLKVGYYTSPHYQDFRERMKINGVLMPKKFVVQWVNQHSALLERIQPSFFEMTVAMAFDYFAQAQVDLAIIETGLGGRLDSTNVVTPLLSIITNIQFDHMDLLGDTLPLIAAEKAGIIKHRVPVVIGETHPETKPVFLAKADEMNAPIYFADAHFQAIPLGGNFTNVEYEIIEDSVFWKSPLSVNMLGPYQRKNVTTSLQALQVLNALGSLPFLSKEDVQAAWQELQQKTYFLGRWQLLEREPFTICDSAHNEQGLEAVIPSFSSLPFDRLHFVLGAVKDKDLEKMLSQFPANACYYFATPRVPRGLDARAFQSQAAQHGLHGKVYGSVRKAWAAARRAAHPNDGIYIGGSSFVAAEVVAEERFLSKV